MKERISFEVYVMFFNVGNVIVGMVVNLYMMNRFVFCYFGCSVFFVDVGIKGW